MTPEQKATRERQAALILVHPDAWPEFTEGRAYLMRYPGNMDSTAAWVTFRDKALLPWLAEHPDNFGLNNFLRQITDVLTWRASIAPEDCFWKADPVKW